MIYRSKMGFLKQFFIFLGTKIVKKNKSQTRTDNEKIEKIDKC